MDSESSRKEKDSATRRKYHSDSSFPRSNLEELTQTMLPTSFVPAKNLVRNHDTSTPHRSETTGTAERAVQRVREGRASVLAHTGLTGWWNDAMECYCYFWNIHDSLADGQAAHQTRFDAPFRGSFCTVGAEINSKPISPKDNKRLHQLGRTMLLEHIHRTRAAYGRVTC